MIKLSPGRPVARALAGLGLLVTAISIGLAALPPEDAADPGLVVGKVVGSCVGLLLLGALLYARSRGRMSAGGG